MASSGTVVGYASLIGHTLGEYEVLALIGRGAMGTVYLARDLGLNRNVALKVLLGSLARSPDLVRGFHREAQAAAPLRHPNIVQIYAAGVEGGVPFIAMEYVEGEPLDRFLRRQGRIPWQTALYIAQQVADALDCAHRHGVIHRDVKPANILLDPHGKARLTDFGIANVASREVDIQHGGFIGTPHYMSPEQCAGKEVGPLSDLYSLGVTMYFMIAGRLPFDSDTPVALIKSITNDDAPRLNRIFPEIPDDVARLVAHLMTKDPAARPVSASAVSKTIERLQAEKGGRSAMPEALRAFMREQTRIRPVRTLVRPGAGVDLDALMRASRRPLPLRAVLGRVISITLTLIVFASLPILNQMLSRPPQPTVRSPSDFPGFSFREVSALMRLAQVNLPAFQFENVRWIGRSSAVLVKALGVPGGLSHGASGLLAIDTENRLGISIQTPAGPVTEPLFWSVRLPAYGPPAPPCSTPGLPLDEVILLPLLAPGPGRGEFSVRIVGRRWDRPTEQVEYFRVPLSRWTSRRHVPWAATTMGYAVPKPNGRTICLVLNDPVDGTNYLVERDVRAPEPMNTGTRLTSGGRRIVPWSVRYSPSGSQLAYLRETDRETCELWVFAFHRDKMNGSPIALGVVGDEPAFSPDESLLAIRVQREREQPELRLISAANGTVVAHLGSGVLGPTPWHPSGKYLVATDSGRVWAVEADAPHRRVPITPEDRTVTKGAAVSKNGEWVAALQDNAEAPTILFVRTARVDFGELPSLTTP